ncbi:MAG: hypothetical protein WC804_21870 [Sphingomonas sp.]|uniref:hypothetical protein n=1 Tax=Sphingomonas sp. TaxID=28214 RepID=UPI003568B9B6
MSDISEGRVIALFNPTPGRAGFLQPLLAGPEGDNQSYVQIVSEDGRIEAFMPVPWPERDVAMLSEKIEVGLDEHSVWAFGFDGEQPLIERWPEFRAKMGSRIATSALADQPLLQFDVVDTLKLDRQKKAVYHAAFQAYRDMHIDGALKWRDRAILEPAVRRRFTAFSKGGPRSPGTDYELKMRVRLFGRRLILTVNDPSAWMPQELKAAYENLAREHPDLFPTDVDANVVRRTYAEAIDNGSDHITIVLVGKLATAHDSRLRSPERGIEVRPFSAKLQIRHSSVLTVLLGTQAEWKLLADAGSRIIGQRAILVALSSSATSVPRDLEFQDRADLPTVTFFAPYATSVVRGRDPVQAIKPLIGILRFQLNEEKVPRDTTTLARHQVLLREPIPSDGDAIAISCRLGSRAFRAGALLDGKASLYIQGAKRAEGAEVQLECAYLLRRLFGLPDQVRRNHLEGGSLAVLLLVERVNKFAEGEYLERMEEGLVRLFEMRGWSVADRRDGSFSVKDGQRKFAVSLAGNGDVSPPLDGTWHSPGLGRSPLLIVHLQARREKLLAANCGPFLNISMDDVALMIPQTSWMWPILRRQLMVSGPLTPGTRRLCASLAIEAIRQNRIEGAISAKLEERLLHGEQNFTPQPGRVDGNRVRFSMATNGDQPNQQLDLTIEDDGPFLRCLSPEI